MKFHGITLQEGSTVANMTLASGTSFPSNPNEGELFFRSDSDTSVRGMYAYIGGNWDRLASADALTVPSAANFPSTANVGDLFYKDSNDVNEALYVFNGSSWVATGNSGGTSTVDGDLSGTISIGGTSTLTLDNVASAGTSGSASKTVTITIDAKGRVTSLTEQDVAIAASQVTSGTFADARIAQSNVTQHQAAISVAASQVTSGTFADARIAQSNVTQHQAALTIAETQITNGSVLARVADNENISGNWAFNGTVSGQTPTNGAHLVTKDYADALATGLDFKQSVKAATTTNITLSGSQTIDGVAISAGMRVLVKDQTDGTQNGIYVAASGAWTRAADADNTPSNEVTSGMFCYVEEGTVNADSGWVLATNDVITLGSTNLVFTQFTGLGQITAGNGLTKSGNTINVGGTAGRIVVNVDDIDLATVTDSGTGSFKKISVDSYGRVTGTTDVVSSDITSLVDSTYVNVAGDTMTGLLTISHTGNGLVVASTDSTPANNSGIILNTTANATASSRVATIVLDANGADVVGLDYVTLDAFGSGDFTINNRSAAAITFQTNTTERMRIDSSGNIGIGTTPTFFVHAKQDANASAVGQIENASAGAAANARWIASNGTNSIGIQITGTGNTTPNIASLYASGATTPLTFATNGAERVRIDSSGNVSIGASSASGKLDVSATDPSTYITRYVAGAGGANIYLRHSRSGTVGTNAILNSGDTIGTLVFAGANGTAYGDSAYIQVQVDGTPSATAMPGRLIFSTSTTASSTPTERMRIDSAGNVGIGTLSPGKPLDVVGEAVNAVAVRIRGRLADNIGNLEFTSNDGATSYGVLQGRAGSELRLVSNGATFISAYTNGLERMRIDASGNVGIGGAPSGWSAYKALQLVLGNLAYNGGFTVLGTNSFYNGTAWTYQSTNRALDYYQDIVGGNHVWRTAASGTSGNTITWNTSMTLNANGNLGLGATPSSWVSGRALELGTAGNALWGFSGSVVLSQNTAGYSTNFLYATTAAATRYQQTAGQHQWHTAPSGTAGTAITFTQAMTLDASGNLLRGTTTSPFGGDQTGYVNSNGTQTATWGVSATYGGAFIGSYSNHSFGVLTNNTTRIFVDSSGWSRFTMGGSQVYIGSGLVSDGTTNDSVIRWDASGALKITKVTATIAEFDQSNNFLLKGGGGLGYGSGSGGTVTQATSKSTSVTLNKPSGQITMNNAALASNAVVAFPLSCSQIAAGDIVAVSLRSGHATAGTYQVWSEASTAGTVTICVRNISGSSLSEALVLNYSIIKGATS